MKKIVFFLILILLVFMVQGEEKVEIKEGEPFWYMYMEFQGSSSQTPEKIRLFFQEVGKQKLQPQFRGHLFGLYYQGRSQGEEPRLDIGIKISRDTSVKLPLKKVEYNYKKIAVYIHIGPYELVGNAFNVIFPALEEKGFAVNGPIMNRWLDDDPDQVKPENYRTEIIIPVKKRSK
ncbi:MAG: GyrI-like domain-containing protein [Candidatus Aminicenantes bacterium]|nr:GyrI-like domain-containing protein [Candidatus Aminicenantes bacterium]